MNAGSITSVTMVLIVVAACSPASPVPSGSQPPAAGPTVTAGVSATPRPTQVVVAGASRIPSGGEIEPGRYFVPKGPWTAVTFSYTMPGGWIAENGGQTISRHPNESGRQVGFSVSIVDRLFADPCGPNDTLEIGPTADDLAQALRQLPGPEVSAPTALTVGGLPGLVVEMTVSADIDVEACDPPIGLQIWLDRNANKYLVAGPEALARIYAVDVAGERFVLVAGHDWTAAASDIAELDAIIESIRFAL